jgi:hypothetical protein
LSHNRSSRIALFYSSKFDQAKGDSHKYYGSLIRTDPPPFLASTAAKIHKRRITHAMPQQPNNRLPVISKEMLARRSIGSLRPENSVLFLCDIQERFRPIIYESQSMICRSVFMNQVCKTLEIPVIVTEHYREVFGPTVSELKLEDNGGRVFQKR